MTGINATIQHDGEPPFFLVVEIEHKFEDGCHIFTSKKIPGLLVMSQSREIAIKQLVPVIESLMKRNKGVSCTVALGTDDENTDDPDYAIIRKAA